MLKLLFILNQIVMPIDPGTATAITAGVNAAVQGANMFATGSMNRKTRQWNEAMYERQKADNIAQWHMQNLYNSPKAVMERYKDANLNPNLIYGNGTSANAGSINNASMDSWRPEVPRIDAGSIGSVLGQYFDTRVKQAQLDNLEAQNSVIVQDGILRAAQVQSTLAGTERTRFDLQQADRLKDVSAQTAEQQLRKLEVDTAGSLTQQEIAKAQSTMSLQKGVEEILNMRSQRSLNAQQSAQIAEAIKNMRKDGTLKDMDIELRKTGVLPGDALWQRLLAKFISKYLDGEVSTPLSGGWWQPGKSSKGTAPWVDTTGSDSALRSLYKERFGKEFPKKKNR